MPEPIIKIISDAGRQSSSQGKAAGTKNHAFGGEYLQNQLESDFETDSGRPDPGSPGLFYGGIPAANLSSCWGNWQKFPCVHGKFCPAEKNWPYMRRLFGFAGLNFLHPGLREGGGEYFAGQMNGGRAADFTGERGSGLLPAFIPKGFGTVSAYKRAQVEKGESLPLHEAV